VNPCKHPIVILKDIGYKELESLLQFMYRGEVNVRQEELTTFLKTAEMLQIKGLTGNDTSKVSNFSIQSLLIIFQVLLAFLLSNMLYLFSRKMQYKLRFLSPLKCLM